jgi:hypothetical protein
MTAALLSRCSARIEMVVDIIEVKIVILLLHMKKTKSVIGFIFLVGVCVTSLWAEYYLAIRFAIMFSVASVFGLSVLLGALLRAPEGYENENGFHVRARRKQARRPRHILAIPGSRS